MAVRQVRYARQVRQGGGKQARRDCARWSIIKQGENEEEQEEEEEEQEEESVYQNC